MTKELSGEQGGSGQQANKETDPKGRDQERNVAQPEVAAVALGPLAVSFAEFVAADEGDSDREWLVEGLLPANALAILGGNPKTGKTLFALDLGFAVASGSPFLARETARGGFLYVTEEGSPAEMRKRAKRLLESRPPDLPARIVYRQGVRIDDPRSWDQLRTEISLLGEPALVVLDPLRELILGDENDSATINSVGRAIRGVLTDFRGVTVLLLHHLRKRAETDGGQRLRGSSALWGAADCTLIFETDAPAGEAKEEVAMRGRLYIEPRNAAKSTVGWEWHLATGRFHPSEVTKGSIADRAYDLLSLQGPSSTNSIAEALGTTGAVIRTTLGRNHARFRFRSSPGQVGGDDPSAIWSLVEDEEPS